MYKEFYNLKAMPFDQAIDQKSIFLSENFETPLAVLVSGLDKGIKLHVVYGEQGVGKTTFISYVYQHIQLHCKAGFLNEGYQSKSTFLAHAIECLGHKAKGGSILDLLDQLSIILENAYTKNRNLPSLLVIDNADTLNHDIFETIRDLLLLNIGNNSILQIILVGHNQLSKNLDTFQNQTILKHIEIVRNHLKPLTFQETLNYIHHRLKIVGSSNQHLFNEQTCLALYEISGGIPYEINSLCHQALVLASSRKVNQISPNLIKDLNVFGVKTGLIEQLDISKKAANDSKNSLNQNWKQLIPLAGAVSLLLLVVGLDQYASLTPKNLTPSQSIVETKVPSITEQEVTIASIKNRSETDIKPLNKAEITKTDPIKPPDFTHINNESPQDKKIISRNQNTQIDLFLAKAERQILDSKLLTPSHDNAYSTYTAILSKMPGEKRALSGLHKIAERYLIMANNKLQQGEFPQSKTFIKRGLKAVPNHQKLIALNNQINYQLAKQNQQIKIQSLLSQANQQLESLNLFEPKQYKAYLTYLEILEIDNKNSKALHGIDSINYQLTQQINSLFDKRNYKSVLLIASNISFMPSADKHLNSAFKTAKNSKKLVAGIITKLNAEAGQYLDSKQYVTPEGRNAAERFRQILTIDPSNELAHSGLNKINKQYQFLAKNALSLGKNKEAFALVNTGLKAFPYNENLLELQNKISIVLSEQRIQIAGNVRTEHNKIEVKKQLRPFGNF